MTYFLSYFLPYCSIVIANIIMHYCCIKILVHGIEQCICLQHLFKHWLNCIGLYIFCNTVQYQYYTWTPALQHQRILSADWIICVECAHIFVSCCFSIQYSSLVFLLWLKGIQQNDVRAALSLWRSFSLSAHIQYVQQLYPDHAALILTKLQSASLFIRAATRDKAAIFYIYFSSKVTYLNFPWWIHSFPNGAANSGKSSFHWGICVNGYSFLTVHWPTLCMLLPHTQVHTIPAYFTVI
jgi:hypothetical protein